MAERQTRRLIKLVHRSNDKTRRIDELQDELRDYQMHVLLQLKENYGDKEAERLFVQMMAQSTPVAMPRPPPPRAPAARPASPPAAACARPVLDIYANELLEDGVTVINIHAFAANAARLRNELEAEVLRFPEFLKHASFKDLDVKNPVRYGLGGTSFVGSPSVFHTPFVRKIRQQAMHELIPMLFKPLVRELEEEVGGRLFFHQLIDRIMLRPKGSDPQKEGWHRDVAPGSTSEDHTFGGWINLDTDDQKFVAVKKSHKAGRGAKLGFGTIPKEDHARYNAAIAAQANQRNCDDKGLIIIPPGCIVVFYENLVHSVYGGTTKSTKVRQFLGWRITRDRDSTGVVDPENRPYSRPQIEAMMYAQAVIPLKSGQVPPMYPGLYCSSNKASMPTWRKFEAENIVPNSMRYPEEERKGNTAKRNNDYTRAMRSLSEIVPPSQMHPPYAAHELELIFPGREFQLENPETRQIEIVRL
jgi:hypothetical protein